MSEQKQPVVYHIPVWGLFLLFLGIVFLLQTLNVLPWGLWGTLWRFWPVVLIAFGLGILLRRYNPWLISLLILAILFGCLGTAIWQYHPSSPGQTTKSYSERLDNLTTASVEIDFNAGNLSLSALDAGSSNLVEASQTAKDGGEIATDFRRQDSRGTLKLSTERANQKHWSETSWDVRLTRRMPLTMEVKSAVGNVDLDFTELQVNELRMDVDVGNYTVKMPPSAGLTRAYIKSDVANLEIAIPENVAARIKADISLAALEIDRNRFPQQGDYYVSKDFDSAKNRIELELDCDIGRVEVK